MCLWLPRGFELSPITKLPNFSSTSISFKCFRNGDIPFHSWWCLTETDIYAFDNSFYLKFYVDSFSVSQHVFATVMFIGVCVLYIVLISIFFKKQIASAVQKIGRNFEDYLHLLSPIVKLFEAIDVNTLWISCMFN